MGLCPHPSAWTLRQARRQLTHQKTAVQQSDIGPATAKSLAHGTPDSRLCLLSGLSTVAVTIIGQTIAFAVIWGRQSQMLLDMKDEIKLLRENVVYQDRNDVELRDIRRRLEHIERSG